MKKRSRNYARRQLTWMRKIPNLDAIDRTGRDDVAEIADDRAANRLRAREIREVAGAGQRLPDRRARELPWELTAKRVEWLCDPHFGIGSDGILLLSRTR